MRRVLVFGGIGLLVLIVAGLAVIWLHGLDYAQDRASREVYDATGRELTFNGETSVDWEETFRPRFVFRDLRLSNATWARDEDMVRIDRFEAVLDLGALVTFAVELPELIVDGLDASLEKNGEGLANWSFDKDLVTDAAVPEDRGELPLIGRFEIRNSAINYLDPTIELDIEAGIDSVVAHAEGAGAGDYGPVEVEAAGTYRGPEVSARGEVGNPQILRDPTVPYPVRANISAGQTRIVVDGTIADPLNFEDFDVRLEVEGPNAEELFPLFGIATPATPPYSLAAQVQREGATVRIRDLSGRVGDSDLSGTLTIDTAQSPIFMEGELHSDTLDFDDIGPLVGAPPASGEGETASQAQRAQAQQEAATGSVLPDEPLDVERLQSLNANLVYDAKSIRSGFAPLDDVELKLSIRDGVLKMEPLDVRIAGGQAVAFVTIDSNVPEICSALDLRVQDVDVAQIANAVVGENNTAGTVTGRVELHAVGNTIKRALGNSNGQIGLVVQDAQLSHIIIELAGLDVGQALGVLLDGDEPLTVRCAAATAKVSGGVADIGSMVIDTTDSNISADGQVALGAEQLDLTIEAHPKDISLLSLRTPVTVGGTFADPAIGIEPGQAAMRAGAAVALGTLLTPLAGILGFLDIGLGEDADCRALIDEARAAGAPADKPSGQPTIEWKQ